MTGLENARMAATETATDTLATAAELRAWADDADSRQRFSPLSADKCLLVDAHADVGIIERRWLKSLPCPTLAVGNGPLASCCDVAVGNVAEAMRLTARIRRAPLAAATLAQVLRTTEHTALEHGLTVESLAYATLQSGPEFRHWLAGYRPTATAARASGPAVVIERDGEAVSLILNRTATHNAMSVDMRDALIEALTLVLDDRSIRRVRLSARGRCFSVGGELAEFGTAADAANAHTVRMLTLPGRLLARCAARVTVQVHGACIGSGIEFPAFARRVVARSDAWFQLPELNYGLIPGAGGCISIARRIGRQRTAWLALSGRRLDARTALHWGLVDALI